ncbi:unnamed protein product [Cylicocyclus nassatus]|uniref:Uncharacterized protein n=1 Tax=Cylicocyclus nassatus TaxID=53992 RepID=A0AA36H2E2_CYLNA|nr:unnamed protein product [Cylicocyclus nassatus]
MDKIVEDMEKEAEKNKEPDTKWRKMREAIRDWADSSSCHGIPHMAQASTCLAAVLWSVILAFCAVGFVFLFTDTLRQYLRFDKVVELNLGLESSMFPSITFCNVNPYKRSKIEMVPALKALMDVYELSASGSLYTES